MPYSREISRDHKACFLFLLDQSYSMEEPLGGSTMRKCDELATAVNNWLHNMALRAAGDEGVRDWMDVGVIGYRTDQKANPIIESALQGELAKSPLVSIVDIAENPARIETTIELIDDEETGETIEMPCDSPVWVEPVAEGSTPMCHVFQHAYAILAPWIEKHPASFPPIVIHITDGESQDGEPDEFARELTGLQTSDGGVLLFNCHLSMTAAEPILFPPSDADFQDELGKMLFRISSELPPLFVNSAQAEGYDARPGARGVSFNTDMAVLIKFLDMGTRATMTLR